jgi:hypothetical protein
MSVERRPGASAEGVPPWNRTDNRTRFEGVSDDQDQEQPAQRAALPQADGPLVDVALPDGQHLFAVVKSRRREPDGSWWYDLQVHLPSQGRNEMGRLLALPAAVDFRAPAEACEPIEGQAYGSVPTVRDGVAPAWRIEEPVCFGPQKGPARIVHRGDCRAVRDVSRPASTEQARGVLERDDAAPCPVCRPDRPLSLPRSRRAAARSSP